MSHPVNDHALDVIFRDGRSYNGFQDKDVPEVLVRAVYDLAKMGPTSANCSPARFVFVSSAEGKERLLPLVSQGNQQKVKEAKWSVIIAYDMEFREKIPKLFPHNPSAKHWFDSNREETAFRNGSLQSAYFLMAARSLGLDTGPMSGFDMDAVNKEFFENQDGEEKELARQLDLQSWIWRQIDHFARSPRLHFDEACRIV